MRSKLAIIFCGIALIAMFVSISAQRGSQKVPQTTSATSISVAYERTRIHVLGAEAAYREFATAVAPLGPNQQHGAAHTFGSALFQEVGTAGVSVCDDQFSYGCYHAFLAEDIRANGIATVPTLAQECSHALHPTACTHGIGHGLVGYFGYDGANIDLL